MYIKPNDDEKIVEAMKEILSKNSKYGCTMVHLKLRQKGILINHKKTERIYNEQGFQLRSSRRRKKIAAEERVPVELPDEPTKLWAMDFISDSISGNRKLKILTVIDPVTT